MASQQSAQNSTVLWVTYINIVLYALSYQLQRPVEPFLVQQLKEHSGSSTDTVNQVYGNLESFFSFCQWFGSPIVGVLLDRIGIRKTSCLVFVASALSYAILSVATDLKLLFLSKIPTIFQAAFLVAQATAATSTGNDSSARAAALGRMTTSYTIGGTIGPALGGWLAKKDLYVGARFAVLFSLVSAVLSLLFLPDSAGKDEAGDSAKITATSTQTNTITPAVETKGQPSIFKKKRSFADDLRHSREIATRPNIWPLLMVKVLGGVIASMHGTALPLVLTQTLHFEPQQLGLSMSISMAAVAGFGAFAMAPLTKALGSFGMMNTGLVARSMLGLAMAAIVSLSSKAENTESNLMRVIAVSTLYALSQHILATGLTTQTTGNVDKQEQGALLGLEHSLFSLARIGGPALGTTLLGLGGLWSVEFACGSCDLLLATSLSMALPHSSKRKNV